MRLSGRACRWRRQRAGRRTSAAGSMPGSGSPGGCRRPRPASAAAVKGSATRQSTPVVASLEVSATPQLTAMTRSDVPTAIGISKPKASTRAGTMMKPPPTPKNPVMNPTTVPATTTLATVDIRTGHAPGWEPRGDGRVVVDRGGVEMARRARIRAGRVGRGDWAGGRTRRTVAAAAMRSCHRAVTHMRHAAIIMTPAKAASRTSGLTDRFRRVPSRDPATPARLNHRPAATRTRPARQ